MALMQLTHHSQERQLGQCIARIYHHTQINCLASFKQHCFNEICRVLELGPSYWLIEDHDERVLVQTSLGNDSATFPVALNETQLKLLRTFPTNGIVNKLDSTTLIPQYPACALSVEQAESGLVHRFCFSPTQNEAQLSDTNSHQLQLIVPHLAAATRLKTLQSARLMGRLQGFAHAICLPSGVILEMTESFRELLARNFTECRGTSLPFKFSPPQAFVEKGDYIFHFEPLLGYVLVEVICFGKCFSDLSHKERQVCFLLKNKKTNKQIAEALHISKKTVDNHLTNIYRKTGLSSRNAVIAELG